MPHMASMHDHIGEFACAKYSSRGRSQARLIEVSMNNKKYCGSYDILKFTAALMVVFYHLYNMLGLSSTYPITDVISVYVELFFILSGFFLMAHVDTLPADAGETVVGYLLHKCGGFFGALCIVNAVHFFFFCNYNGIRTVAGVLSQLWHFKWEFLMLQCGNFIRDPQFNTDYLVGATWYLSAMMITQAVIYPLARYYRKSFLHIICPIMILFVYSFSMQKYGTTNIGKDITYLLPDSLYRAFAGQCCGVLAYEFHCRAQKTHFFEKKEGAILDTACWLVIPLTLVLTFSGVQDADVFCVIPFMLIAASAAIGVTPVARMLQHIPAKTCKKLGKFSLYIYLTHFAVLCTVTQYLKEYSLSVRTLACLAGTAVYSSVLYLIDRRRKSVYPIVIISVLAVTASLLSCLV